MKTCAECHKEIPEAARHCVFCGAGQAAPRATGETLGYPGLPATAGEPVGGNQTGPDPHANAGAEPATADTTHASASAPDRQPAAARTEPTELPPYLASETHTRADAPIEPWDRTLRGLARIAGVAAGLAVFAPWRVEQAGATFSWTLLFAGPRELATIAALLALTAGVAFAVAALPLRFMGRARAAAGLGCAGVIAAAMVGAPAFAPRSTAPLAPGAAIAIAMLALAIGLLLRAAYRRARSPRIWLSVTAAALAAIYLWPGDDGSLAAVATAALGDGGLAGRIAALHALVPLGLAGAALASWAPASTGAGAGWMAWLALAWAPSAPLVAALGATESPAHHLYLLFHAPIGLAAWYGLGAFGAASVVGKRLEHSES